MNWKPSTWRGIAYASVLACVVSAQRCADEKLAEDHYGQKIDSLLVDNARKESRAIAAEVKAERITAIADSIAKRAAGLKQQTRDRIVVVRDSFPALSHSDTVRDALIDSLVVESDKWALAYRTQLFAHNLLSAANDLNKQRADNAERLLKEYKPAKKPSRFSLGCTVGQAVTMWGTGPGFACGVSYRGFP